MLKLQNVTKVFFEGTANEFTAVDKLNLELRKGEFVSVIGSNGAGKTTLMNLIAGTYSPTSGDIYIDGKKCTNMPEYLRAKFVGRVFQDPLMGTAAGMTVAQNLALAYRKGNRGLGIGVTSARRKIFREELSRLNLGLEDRLDDRVEHLSGGQRQSLTVLMATLTTPKILLLDEHTAALDPANAQRIMDLTARLVREKQLTTLMITHNMKQALELGDRLIMLHKGKIILDICGEKKISVVH